MRHEDIQRLYPNHYFTSFRSKGSVRKLVGNIDVLVFFVNDTQSTWTDQAKQQYRAVQKAAMQWILNTARLKGVNLQLRNAYIDTTVPMNCTPENYESWTKAIAAKYRKSTVSEFQDNYEATHQRSEAPVIFVLNKPFRSRAVCMDRETQISGEMAIISSEYSKHIIIHELLHQFGAVDLYYPREVKDMVQKMHYRSVMLSADSLHIDSLNAYLIGWTEEIDGNAAKILELTKHYTREYMLWSIKRQYENS